MGTTDTMTVDTEWAAVYNSRVITKRATKAQLLEWLEDSMYSRASIDVVSVSTGESPLT